MLAAAIAFAVAALAFAGISVALAIAGSKHKVEAFRQIGFAKQAQFKADEFEDQLHSLNRFRGADKKEISALKRRIKDYQDLIRKHAPDGAGASEFTRLLQEAADKDRDEDDLLEDTVPGVETT